MLPSYETAVLRSFSPTSSCGHIWLFAQTSHTSMIKIWSQHPPRYHYMYLVQFHIVL